MNIKSKGIYHTDFTAQVSEIKSDPSLIKLVDSFTHYFYQLCDEVHVTTKSYMNILESRGIDRHKMKLFERGVDPETFYPRKYGKIYLKQNFNLNEGIYFLYTGRISKDKNLDIITKAFSELSKEYQNIFLLLVGDGPYKKELEKSIKNNRIIFTGKIDRNLLPEIYSGSDVFLFPSTTDTYGMSVLEAQACELPCLVSDKGGPQDLIVPNKTGYVLEGLNIQCWKNKMKEFISAINKKDKFIYEMKRSAVMNAQKKGDWNRFLKNFLQYE